MPNPQKFSGPWISCDGDGNYGRPEVIRQPKATTKIEGVSRRGLLVGASMASLAWASRGTALAGFTVSEEKKDNVLIVIFLRGGADGMSVLVPFFEDQYYKIRPNIAITERQSIKLDDKFGLHPAFDPIKPLIEEKKLLAIHAVGSFDQTRSHFEAMSAMERGLANDGAGPASGWLGRYLAASARPDHTPLRAVAFGSTMPDAFRGGINAIGLNSIADYRLNGSDAERKELVQRLRKLCAVGDDAASEAGRSTLAVLESVQNLKMSTDLEARGIKYPETGLGQGLKETATLMRSGIGMEVAFLNMGGWDTHVTQGSTAGWMPGLLGELGTALGAFAKDLGPLLDKATIVVKSEFGRRAYENGGLGTDHGRAGAMLVMGGGIKKPGVYADWPGLKPDELEGPGDLRVTTDYRSVLKEILAKRHGFNDAGEVFPSFKGATSNFLA